MDEPAVAADMVAVAAAWAAVAAAIAIARAVSGWLTAPMKVCSLLARQTPPLRARMAAAMVAVAAMWAAVVPRMPRMLVG